MVKHFPMRSLSIPRFSAKWPSTCREPVLKVADFGSCRGKTVLHMVWSLSVASLDGELQKYPFANVERATVTLNRASDMGYSGPELHNVLELASLYEAKRFGLYF